MATVKVVKDPAAPRDDTYKSGTIHTGPGESPSSVSRPTPKGKQASARPVTKGKLLRPGGPGGGPSKLATSRRTPAPAQPLPHRPTPAAQPAPPPQPKPAPQPVAAAAASHAHTNSTGSMRAPPPPPPAAPPAPKKPMAKVLYDFTSDRSNELTIRAGETVQIVSKEGNGKPPSPTNSQPELTNNPGWWLCMNSTTSTQGWTPEAYLEEQAAPPPTSKPAPPPAPPTSRPSPSPTPPANGTTAAAAAKAKPAPPAPPAKRPNMAARKMAPPPPPAAPRDSAVSMNSAESSGGSGRGTPNSSSNASLAGGLAEALRARQNAMHGQRDEDDEW